MPRRASYAGCDGVRRGVFQARKAERACQSPRGALDCAQPCFSKMGATGIDLRDEDVVAGRGFSWAPISNERKKLEANEQLALAA